MKTVLFVCVHNAGRSQIAEALFNHIASNQGLAVRAESAGTQGGKQLNPMAVKAMEEIGIPLTGAPKLLTQEMVDRSMKIISMGCGVDAEACPAKFLLTDDWELEDPAGQEIEAVRKIRDEIRRRVSSLVQELA